MSPSEPAAHCWAEAGSASEHDQQMLRPLAHVPPPSTGAPASMQLSWEAPAGTTRLGRARASG